MPGARRSIATARRINTGVIYAYAFAGTDAAPWASPWTSVAGTVDIQSDAGRLQTSTTVYSAAAVRYDAAMPFNFDWTGAATITTVTSTEFYGIINVRAGSDAFTDIRQHSSWNLRFYGGTGVGLCELYRVDAAGIYSPLLAAGSDIDFVQGSVLRVRIRVEGSNIKVRYWKNAETEPPSAWQIDFTDPTAPSGASMSLACRNGNDAAADVWHWSSVGYTSIVTGPPTGTVARTFTNIAVVAAGTAASGAFAPPTAAAISGMSATPYRDYDWTNTSVVWTGDPAWGSVSDFQIVNGDDTPNNEKSASKPSNVTIENDASCSGGKFLRLTTRRETWKGQPFSGVQMENFGVGFGAGQQFFVECRLRWVGYEGCWPGPWMYDLGGTNSEIDIMETPNTRQPWTTLHPYGWAQNVHVGAQYAAANDGQWHRYGLRVDRTGIYRYFDNVFVSSYTNTTHAGVFVDANMGFKFQHFCGGNWPDDDLGLAHGTTPRAGVAFPNYFDCDWLRIYRPAASGTTRYVPAQGTLQQVADAAQPGDTIEVSGTLDYGGHALYLINRNNGANPITVIGQPGNLIRSSGGCGILGYGSNRGWTFQNLNIQVSGGNNGGPYDSGNNYYGEGIYLAGDRFDDGADGAGCANIRVLGCNISAMPGTGSIQRHCVALWGGDVLEVGNCDLQGPSGWNDNGFFGGAASGISIGRSVGSAATSSLSNGSRIWIHDNLIRNVYGPGTSSADRNGIIMDLLHGWLDSPNRFYPDRSVGAIVIHNNDIANCEGRGIQILCAGAADSQLTISNNLVRAPIATNLGGSEPIAGIGGYGVGICGNVICDNNDVTVSGSAYAYHFFDFNGSMDASIQGVRGGGNIGTPRNFNGSSPGF